MEKFVNRITTKRPEVDPMSAKGRKQLSAKAPGRGGVSAGGAARDGHATGFNPSNAGLMRL